MVEHILIGDKYSLGWAAFDDVSLRPVVTYNLSYDAENRLTSVSGAAAATFVYDGDGRRVKATVSGVTTVYVGDYFEWTGSTSTMIKYYYAGATRIAMRVGSGTGTSGLSWLLSDHLGSTNVATDGNGANPITQRYKTWGETRFSSGTLPTKRQYTGQINETGLGGIYFYGARWWDPSLGRFLSADTIIPLASQGVQAWDRYAGMNNNPVRYNDPSGHCIGPFAVFAVYCVLGAVAVIGAISEAVQELNSSSPDPRFTSAPGPSTTPTPPQLTPTPTSSNPTASTTPDPVTIVDAIDVVEYYGDVILGPDLSGKPNLYDLAAANPYTAPMAPSLMLLEAGWGTKQQLDIDFSDEVELILSRTAPPVPTIGPSATPSATIPPTPTYTPIPPTGTPTPYLLTPTVTPN